MEVTFLEDNDKPGVRTLAYPINMDQHLNEPRHFRKPVKTREDRDFWKQSREKTGGFVLVF